MGYRIRYRDVEIRDLGVSAPVGQLLHRLRINPHAIFGRPYAGYMLWVVGAGQQEILKWVTENLSALDALTGELVAFAIVAQEFRFPAIRRTKTIQKRAGSWRRHSRNCDEEAEEAAGERAALDSVKVDIGELGDSWVVSPLGPSLGTSWPADTREIDAVMYAAEAIAVKLGIVDQLPCVLFFDPVETENYALVELTPGTMPDFMKFLRSLLHALNEDGRAQSFLGRVEMLGTVERQLNDVRQRASEAAMKISALEAKVAQTSVRPSILLACSDALGRGNLRQLLQYVSHGRRLGEFEAEACASVCDAAEKQLTQLRLKARNVQVLERFAQRDWPLPPELRRRYEEVLTKYVFPAISGMSIGFDFASRNGCERALSLARSDLDRQVQDLLGPLEGRWVQTRWSLETELMSQRAMHSAIHREQETMQTSLTSLARETLSEESVPKFSKLATQCAQRQRLRTITRSVGRGALSLFTDGVSKALLKGLGHLLGGA